jgi:hypothetical protein
MSAPILFYGKSHDIIYFIVQNVTLNADGMNLQDTNHEVDDDDFIVKYSCHIMIFFHSNVITCIFQDNIWPKIEEIGELQKLHNEKLCNLYPLSKIIRFTKSRRRLEGKGR